MAIRRRLHLVVLTSIVGVAVSLAALLASKGVPSGSVYDPAPVTLLALVLAALVTLYPAFRNVLYGEDLLEPTVVIGGLLFAYFPLSAFSISVLGLSPAFPSFIDAAHRILPAFTLGLVVIAVGAVAVYAGYRMARSRRWAETWPAVGNRLLLVANVVVLWLLSVGIHLLGSLGFVPRGNAILFHLTTWHFLAALVVLASYYSSDGTITSVWFVTVVLLVEAAVVTMAGFDLNSVLVLLTYLVLAYHYVGPGITIRKLVAIGGAIVVLFPVSEIAEDLQAGRTITAALGHRDLVWYFDAFAGRMIGTDALTMIIARTPDPVPFQAGETLLLGVYGLIPRVVWPGKPSLIMCGVNNQYFSGRGEAANTCAAMTVPGEFYWNFGAAGVVIGLFFIGLLLGGIYRWFRYGYGGPRNYVLLTIYALVLLQVMRFESGFAQLVSNLVKGVGFAAIFLWFVTEPRHEGSFVLEGDSAFERSWSFRFGRTLASGVRVVPPPVRTRLRRLWRQLMAVPEWSATMIRASQSCAHARTLVGTFCARSAAFVSTIRAAWRSSGTRWTITRSRTWRVLSSIR